MDDLKSLSSSVPRVSSRAAIKSQRLLACVFCQQRKVKCDRKTPCSNCIKANAQCVPATLAKRQRRRRFAERELLERIREYEALLRENNIDFDPLHPSDTQQASDKQFSRRCTPNAREITVETSTEAEDTRSEATTVKSETIYEAKNFWDAMYQSSREPDEIGYEDDSDDSQDELCEDSVREAWIRMHRGSDHLLFGSRNANVELNALHPEQLKIFKLWQIYLENVNPLLKVTHAPTLQARIIDGASDLANIDPNLEALMFGIYCMAILSLDEDSCYAALGSARADLLTTYQFGCQQALVNCGLLRSQDRDCLTAFYLYLISIRPSTDPCSLSSMLGVALRFAQRLGLHVESANARCAALEAEVRRRLWWSLVIFDARICEMAHYKAAMLVPTWDCKIPQNLDDSDLRPEMSSPPPDHGKFSEAIFTVVRSHMGDIVRHSAFYLDFTNPVMKIICKDLHLTPGPEGSELASLERMVEEKYLQFCNPENPLHFMTIWNVRGWLAKGRLLEYYSICSKSSVQQTEAQRISGTSHALSMLDCDTKIFTSSLTKGYQWHAHKYFPFTGYIHIVQELKRRPFGKLADKAWEVMGCHYDARIISLTQLGHPFFKIFARLILQAWKACEATSSQSSEAVRQPRMVLDIKQKLSQAASTTPDSQSGQHEGFLVTDYDNFPMPMWMGPDPNQLPYSFDGQGPLAARVDDFPGVMPQSTMDVDITQLDWTKID